MLNKNTLVTHVVSPALTALLLLASHTAMGANTCDHPNRIDPTTGAPACWPHPTMDTAPFGKVMLERFEWTAGNDSGYAWEASAWYGTDYNKLWLNTEGEGLLGGDIEAARVELLYSRLISPFFDIRMGLRHDFEPEPGRTFGVLGLSGLAPYGIETDIALYVSEDGDISLESEFEYELRLTPRLVLAPRFEFKLAAQNVPSHDVGSGLTRTEFGLRLRYERWHKFAPYIGVRHERLYGDTRDAAEAEGEPGDDTAVVVGVRAWF